MKKILLCIALIGGLAVTWGCAESALRAPWSPAPLAVDSALAVWTRVPSVEQQDLRVRAIHDSQRLYLELSSAAEHVKDQWMGVYGQSLILFIDPSGREPRQRGLRLTLIPPRGALAPWDPERERGYVGACGASMDRVEPTPGGGFQSRPLRGSDAEWEVHFEGRRLVYRVALDLGPAWGWAQGDRLDHPVGLRIETTPIDPHVRLAVLPPAIDPSAPMRDAEAVPTPTAQAPLTTSAEAATSAAPLTSSTAAADVASGGPSLPDASQPQEGLHIHRSLEDGAADPVARPHPSREALGPPSNVPDPLRVALRLQLAGPDGR